MSNFIQDCLRGDVDMDGIDDYIDAWHDGDGQQPIHRFLGMTELDYKIWVGNPDALSFILLAHKQQAPITAVIRRYEDQTLPMAARSESPDRIGAIREWLEERGLWGQ